MQKITLYRYNRVAGGVTISPVKPDVEYTELFRLVADEGCTLTDGVNHAECVDTDNPEAWEEIAEATDTDYQNALREMGVKV